MRAEQSGIMLICGLLGLMILLMFSSGIALLIVIPFGLPESYLAPVSLASMVGLIAFLVHCAKQDSKRFDQQQVKAKESYDLFWKKRNLFFQAADFEDSRKKIKQRALWDAKAKRCIETEDYGDCSDSSESGSY
jgi:hypothetical protein